MSQSPDGSYLGAGRGAILEAVEAQRHEVMRLAGEDIRRVEDRRERDLRRLDDVAGSLALGESKAETSPPSSTGAPARPERPNGKRRRKGKRQSASQKALESREAVLRLLQEADGPRASGEIRRPLGLTEHTTTNALKKLIAEGAVEKRGTGAHTRYLAARSSGARLGAAQLKTDTIQGKILMILDDRGSASLNELAQALRIPAERVREECAALIAEGEIRMSTAGGAPIYVRMRAAA